MDRTHERRAPVEAIRQRAQYSADCEKRVRKALSKLAKIGRPFTVTDVCRLSGVGRTFIYDPSRSELRASVLTARSASKNIEPEKFSDEIESSAESWRQRAQNAEALAKSLRDTVRERDQTIELLTGQLYDPKGNYLVDTNAELIRLTHTLSANLATAERDVADLRRSLDGARANVLRERERNVRQIFEK